MSEQEAQTFRQQLAPHRDKKYDLLMDDQGPDPSGNCLLYEAHTRQIALDLLGKPLPGVIIQSYDYCNLFKRFKSCEQAFGIFSRKPDMAVPENAHDDYIGIASTTPVEALRIHKRYIINSGFFDANTPSCGLYQAIWEIIKGKRKLETLKFWHGRFLGLKQHYQMGCHKKPSLIGWCAWLIAILWTLRKPGNASGWLLAYLKLRTAIRAFPLNKFVLIASDRYVKALNQHYNGNICFVYREYFGINHPFARFSDWPLPKDKISSL